MYEGIDWLNSRILFGMKAGLDNIQALLLRLNNPHLNLKVVHVAGSNGKGSTIALLDFLLRKKGFKTARYHSPHLVSVVERIRYDDQFIDKDELNSYLLQVKESAEFLKLEPTFFECITCAAFVFFANKNPDIVLLETGLGGRLDSTNVIENTMLSIITSISLEHVQILGNTHKEILNEKLGIVKQNSNLLVHLTGALKEQADSYCVAKESRCYSVDEFIEISALVDSLDLSGRGKYFELNLKTALCAAKILGFTFSELSRYCQDLPQYSWAGRYQKLSAPGMPDILLDGAHNVEGIQALTQSVRHEFGTEVQWVLSASVERNVGQWKIFFEGFEGNVYLPRCEHLKLHTPETLLYSLERGLIFEDVVNCFNELKKNPNQVWVITGSLYFLSEWIMFLREYYPQLSEFKGLKPEFNERSHK